MADKASETASSLASKFSGAGILDKARETVGGGIEDLVAFLIRVGILPPPQGPAPGRQPPLDQPLPQIDPATGQVIQPQNLKSRMVR